MKYMRVRTTAADFKLASIVGESVNGLQRKKRESLLAGSCILLVLLGGCTTNRPPEYITCEKLRGLNVGMSRDEVRRILGDPVYETPPVIPPREGDTTLIWRYHPLESGGDVRFIRLGVTFVDGKLAEADSYEVELWDSGPSRGVFRLDASGRSEGRLFEDIYCPEAQAAPR
jgi:hypothetical protein